MYYKNNWKFKSLNPAVSEFPQDISWLLVIRNYDS